MQRLPPPLLAVLLTLSACSGSSPGSEAARGGGRPGTIAVAPHLDGALRRAWLATAAIRMPYDFDADGKPVVAADGTPLVASCGATFIDAHHAITAAHCLPGQVRDPANRPIEADIFDVAETIPWQKTTTLTGFFPAYDHPRLTEADGYVVHTLTCHLVASCFGSPIVPARSTACPIQAMPSGNADVALLRCDEDLPAGHGAMAIATRPVAVGDALSYFWFHELYFLTADASDAMRRDFFDHYQSYSERAAAENFHYHGWTSNQLLPLASRPFVVDGRTVPQSVVAIDDQLRIVTDHFACHGSSGSGALRLDPASGEYELIGPASVLARDSAELCPTDVQPGAPNLVFTPPEQVRAIAALR